LNFLRGGAYNRPKRKPDRKRGMGGIDLKKLYSISGCEGNNYRTARRGESG